MNTELTAILGESQLKPLDVSINKQFKNSYAGRVDEMSEPNYDTATGCMKWPIISELCTCVTNSQKVVKEEPIIKKYSIRNAIVFDDNSLDEDNKKSDINKTKNNTDSIWNAFYGLKNVVLTPSYIVTVNRHVSNKFTC